MQIMKYGFLFFHVNTNTISLTSISNKRLKPVNTKAVKQKKPDYLRRNSTRIK